MKHTDEQLLTAVRNSDKRAFKALFEKYQPMLFRQTVYRVNDEALAHDIVQETFIRVWQRRTHLKPTLPFYPFILRISRNLMNDHFKRITVRMKYQREVVNASPAGRDDPEEAFHLSRLEEEIIRVVNSNLGERCRAIFLMSRIEGKSHTEIADVLNISLKTVNNQITHALKVLRKKLVQYL